MSCTGTIVSTVKNLFVFFACAYVSIADTSTIETSTFARSAHCPGKVPTWGSRYQTSEARSLVECVGICRLTNACMSVVFDAVNKSCHLSNGKASEDCSNMIPAMTGNKYYEKQSGGQEVNNYTCSLCPDGNCVDICQDCAELMIYGNVKDKGAYWIKPSGAPEPFQIYCSYPSQRDLGKILDHYDPNFNFNRTWQEYRDGFGVVGDRTDYWIGLKNTYYLTSTKAAHLKIRLTLNVSENTVYQNYDDFLMNNEAEGYSMDFSKTSMYGMGDCLGDLKGVAFSTYDMDNDGSDNVNCALQHGGGWWFKGDNCSTCNPLGPMLTPFDGFRKGVMGEVFWTKNLGNLIPNRIKIFLQFL